MIILFIYIFALFVLFSPRIIFHQHFFIHALCFSIILYFTYDLVVIQKEHMNNLETDNIYDSELNVSFSNNHTSGPKSDVLGEMMLKAFERVAQFKTNINKLKTMLTAYDGTDEQLVEMEKIFKETNGNLELLEAKLDKLNERKKELEELTNKINELEVEKKEFQNKLNKCQRDFSNSIIVISNKNTDLEKLRDMIISSVKTTAELNSTINSYQSQIPIQTDEIKNTISTCKLEYLQNKVPWLQEYI